ncbi:MAG: sugar phosphate isomerase/epimerase family protein [Fimbriimonas sp.]
MRLAAQMYTLRDVTKTAAEFEDALAMLHGIGYEGVQLSAVGCMNGDDPEVDAARAREMLDAHGLVACATHRPMPRLIQNLDEEIAFHRTLGCDYVAIGGIGWDYGQTPDAYARFLADARPVIEGLAAAGIRFGFHNHSHEFIRNPETGRPCYDLLIEADEALKLEIDTYWVAHAGADPAALLRRCAGRIEVIHAKDREVVAEEGPVMAPVGEGLLDWDAILAACREGGTEWIVVEQDVCRRDPFECLDASFRFLSDRR